MTPELKEFNKCKKNIVYFVETYCKYLTPDGKIHDVVLTKKKKDFLKALADGNNHKIIAMGYRQSGKTMLEIVFALWKMCFYPMSRVAVVPCLKINASTIYGRFMEMANLLPDWMGFKKDTKSRQPGTFINGSQFVSVWDPEFLRGLSINTLFVDELAFFHQDKREALIKLCAPGFAAMGCKVVFISSVCRKKGLFYETWKQANSEDKQGWIPFEFSISEKMTIDGLKQFVECTDMSGETNGIFEYFQKLIYSNN